MQSQGKVTLVQLQAMPIVGAYYFDAPVFRACYAFIRNPENSVQDKIGAVNVIFKAVGEPQTATEEDIAKCLEED